jgi:hypothetical protein
MWPLLNKVHDKNALKLKHYLMLLIALFLILTLAAK